MRFSNQEMDNALNKNMYASTFDSYININIYFKLKKTIFINIICSNYLSYDYWSAILVYYKWGDIKILIFKPAFKWLLPDII